MMNRCTSYPSRSRSGFLWLAAPLLGSFLAITPPQWAQEGEPLAITDAPSTDVSKTPAAQPAGVDAPAPRNGKAQLMMNFRDASLQAILDYLSEHAGLVVINNIELEERVTVFNLQPVSLDEALSLINSVLRDRGYTTIRRDKLLRIVPLADAKKMSIPVRMGNDPTQIGNSDTIITQIIPMRYADAESLVTNLQPLVDAENAELSANESSNSLIVTNTEANVRRIVEIAQALDQSISQVRDVRVFQLANANAEDTASHIPDVFRQGDSADEQLGRAISQRFGGRGRGGRGGDNDQVDDRGSSAGTEVTASGDERTNSVVVAADPTVMEAIALMIEQLDTDTTAKEAVFIYRVRHTDATELEAIFSALFSGTSIDRSGDGDTTLRQGNTNNRQNNNTNTNGRGGNAQTANDAGSGSASDLVGNVTAVADEATNSLLVLSAEVNFPRIQTILEGLDSPVPQVLVRVLVAELTHENGTDIGTEFSLDAEPGGNTLLQTITNFGAPANGLSFGLLATDFTATLSALETDGILDVLSRPYILTQDNQEAEILVGEEVPFVTNTRVTDTGNTINTIEYQDIGIILNITPQINEQGLVVLDVSQELSSLLDSTVQISEGLQAQRIAKRTANSRIAVPNGQTVVIGGLMQERLTQTFNKVPLLGDIPLLGVLFSRNQVTESKTELLLFLTPEVIMTPDELGPMSERIRHESEAMNDTVEPGALQRHLDKMRGGSLSSTPESDHDISE